MSTRVEVYASLDSEREYQEQCAVRAGTVPGTVRPHSVEEFALYMEDYLHELRHQLSRNWTPDRKPTTQMLDTLRKVTALGVACMEQHGAPHRCRD